MRQRERERAQGLVCLTLGPLCSSLCVFCVRRRVVGVRGQAGLQRTRRFRLKTIKECARVRVLYCFALEADGNRILVEFLGALDTRGLKAGYEQPCGRIVFTLFLFPLSQEAELRAWHSSNVHVPLLVIHCDWARSLLLSEGSEALGLVHVIQMRRRS